VDTEKIKRKLKKRTRPDDIPTSEVERSILHLVLRKCKRDEKYRKMPLENKIQIGKIAEARRSSFLDGSGKWKGKTE